MVVKFKHNFVNYDETRGYFCFVAIPKLAYFTSILPFCGFVFCVIWSLLYNFKETTFTHCKVMNYLPSLSAAIGNHWTQYVVWCLLITTHAPFRVAFIYLLYERNMKIVRHDCMYFVTILSVLNVMEIFSLLGLSYFTSAVSYPIHEKFFLTFMISSEGYMLITCLVGKYCLRNPLDRCRSDDLSHFIKTRLFILNVVCFVIAGYFFIRHNEYCEPGVYTGFAFFEYIVVMSNILFHMTAVIDFKDQYICFHKGGIEFW